MPYKYIGRTIDHKGKTLWEILGNLKNFGVGRIVARNMFERYPEPSYLKIVKVEPFPNPENPSYDNRRIIKVWAERTFRGRKYPDLAIIESPSIKMDYKLIPKDEEESYCQIIKTEKSVKLLPKTIELPPLLKELVIRENLANGVPPEKDNEIEIVFSTGADAFYRPVKDGEKPNVEFSVSLGIPVSPSLYEGTGAVVVEKK